MPCGCWESNCMSGVALTMQHRLKWFIHLWTQTLSKRDEHPALRGMTLYLYLPCEQIR